MNCKICTNLIPEGRLKAMPGVETCVNCSNISKYKGFTVVMHKTGNFTQVIKDPKLFEEIRELDRTKGRARTGYAGAH